MTPFLQIQPRDHPLLLVAFSHIDTPPGEFAQYKVLSALPYAKIFINCPDNGYYLRPIPGVGDSVDAIAARLAREIADIGPSRVVFFGNSMGAFGALLYGARLGADLTLAMAPEVLLGIKGGAMATAAKDKTVRDDPHAKTLPQIVRTAARGERICLFGEKALADMRCALALAGTGAARIGIRNALHSLAPYLHGTAGLAPVIADLIDHGTASPLVAAETGDLLASPRLIESLYDGLFHFKPFGDFATLAARIDAAASEETSAYAWLGYGRRLLETGARRHALPFVLAAALANPGDIEAYALLLRFPEGRRHAHRVDRTALLAAVHAHRFDTTRTYCRFLAALMIGGEATPPDTIAAIAAVGLSPQAEAKVALERARLLAAHGQFDDAETAAIDARERLPAEPDTHVQLAEIRLASGRHADAIAAADAGLARFPDHFLLLWRRAEALERSGAADVAVTEGAYRRALEVRPDFVPLRLGLSRVLERSGRPGEAIAVLTAAAPDGPPVDAPPSAAVLARLGQLQLATGDAAAAADAFRRALALDPLNASLRYRLTETLRRVPANGASSAA